MAAKKTIKDQQPTVLKDNSQLIRDIEDKLSSSETLEDLCKKAVEYGRKNLDFDRVAIFFIVYFPLEIHAKGFFGTDAKGKTTDERNYIFDVEDHPFIKDVIEKNIIFLSDGEVELTTKKKKVGSGQKAIAPLGDGETAIGFIVVDNLIKRRKITSEDCGRLTIFASTIYKLILSIRIKEEAKENIDVKTDYHESFKLITEISNTLSMPKSFDDICRQAVEMGRNVLGYDRISLFFIEMRGQEKVVVGSYGTDEKGDTTDERGVEFSYEENVLIKKFLEKKKNFLSERNAPLYTAEETIGTGRFLLVPMWYGDEIIGFISMDNLITQREITSKDQEILSLYASSVGHLCAMTKAREDLKKKEIKDQELQEKLKNLIEVSNELTMIKTIDELCRRAVEIGLSEFGYDRWGLFLIERCGEESTVVGTYGTDLEGNLSDERVVRFPMEISSIIKDFVEEKKLYLSSPNGDLYYFGNIVGKGMNALIPMWDGQEVIGFISVDNLFKHRVITTEDCELLSQYAVILGHLISRIKIESELKKQKEEEGFFQDKLENLHDVSNDLSLIDNFDELCYKIIELGRSKLGFDRLGLFFTSQDGKYVVGTYGTNTEGNICDEKDGKVLIAESASKELYEKKSRCVIRKNIELLNITTVVGKGDQAVASVMRGDDIIGAISTDNLLSQKGLTESDCKLLSLYAETIGHLSSRIKIQEELRIREEKEEEFHRKLEILHEISNLLSLEETFDALCYQAIDLGRKMLGFDRLGLLFTAEDPRYVVGTYGTDEKGKINDERGKKVLIEKGLGSRIYNEKIRFVLEKESDLKTLEKHVGKGMHAVAGLMKGDEIIGFLSTDNLITHKEITENDCKILSLYAETIGHLSSKTKIQEQLKINEQKEIEFQEKLQALNEISNLLSLEDSFDNLCYQAIYLGRKMLGFDRLGLFFMTEESGVMLGTYGTDADGNITDERGLKIVINDDPLLKKVCTTKNSFILEQEKALRTYGEIVGSGMHVQSPLLRGDEIIGILSTDNLINKQVITERDCKLLSLYAETIGHLSSRLKIQEQLKINERKEREFQERLEVLHEVSNILSLEDTLDGLSYNVIKLGREKLGFDRLGLFFIRDESDIMIGTFGTDENGNISDERTSKIVISSETLTHKVYTEKMSYSMEDITDLRTFGQIVGKGTQVEAPLLKGDKIIGILSMDNLIKREEITERDCKLLSLYAETIGHLSSRMIIQEQLKLNEQNEKDFQEKLRLLNEVTNELSLSTSFDKFCYDAIDLGRKRLGFDRLGLFFIGESKKDKKNVLCGTYGTNEKGKISDERGNEISLEDDPLTARLFDSNHRYFVDRNGALRTLNKKIGQGMHAEAPLIRGDKIIGLLTTDNLLKGEEITDNDCELLAQYASVLGHLSLRIKTEEELIIREQKEKDFQEKLRILHNISNELSRSSSFIDFNRKVVELGTKKLKFERLGLFYTTDQPGKIIGTFGMDDDGILHDESLIISNLEQDILKEILKKKSTYVYRENAELYSLTEKVGAGTSVVAPLWNGEKVIGLIAIDNLHSQKVITKNECELLSLFASTIGHLSLRLNIEEELRNKEQEEREFQERLSVLNQVANELSISKTLDEFCYKAIDLGLHKLDFDRLGLFFIDESKNAVKGTYGTDIDGNISDENDLEFDYAGTSLIEEFIENKGSSLYKEKVMLRFRREDVGEGSLVMSPLWNGEQVMGYLAMDNFINKRPITHRDRELMNQYASTLGHLSLRIRAQQELQLKEQKEREYKERLKVLNEVSNKLSLEKTFDDLCYKAIELGREVLKFDRLGLFFKKDKDYMVGAFGTDEQGNIRDERGVVLVIEENSALNQFAGNKLTYYLNKDARLMYQSDSVGHGMLAIAPIWDGEDVIGIISTDNLLKREEITETDCEFLKQYASTIGHLCSRLEIQNALEKEEEASLDFQEKLRILNEVSNQLSLINNYNDFCYKAIELGKTQLGFTRLGLFMAGDDPEIFEGTYGTGEDGNINDEHSISFLKKEIKVMKLFSSGEKEYYINKKSSTDVFKQKGMEYGQRALAPVWDGNNVIGMISTDNLLDERDITERECKLFIQYASTLGHLSSRLKFQIGLTKEEHDTREFQEKLRILNEVSNELTLIKNYDDFCYKAIELGKNHLGFTRLGIFMTAEDPEILEGSYGTDENGKISDEHHVRFPKNETEVLHSFFSGEQSYHLNKDVQEEIYSQRGVEKGQRAMAPVWDGKEVIGLISTDNLLDNRDINENEIKLLIQYVSTLGHLSSRLRFQIKLTREEQDTREFQEKLRILNEISNELSLVNNYDEFCYKAIELGKNRLEYTRLGLFLNEEDPEILVGMYGIDEDGNIREERNIKFAKKEASGLSLFFEGKQNYFLDKNTPDDLFKQKGIEKAHRAIAPVWDGNNVIGFLSTDNLLDRRDITDRECELLSLFASTLGHLSSRLKFQVGLAKEERETREFQEKLRILNEISNELSLIKNFDEFCYKAIELGKNHLEFTRLGMFLAVEDPEILVGTYGIGEDGNIHDERDKIFVKKESLGLELFFAGKQNYLLDKNIVDNEIYIEKKIETPQRALAPVWDGNDVMGFLSTDNLLDRRDITEKEGKLLTQYAATLGHLSSRLKFQIGLANEERETKEFQIKLRILNEVSNELTIAKSFDDFCYQAIFLAKAKLGFDRIGLFFRDKENDMIEGTYGTDEKGNIVNEHYLKFSSNTSKSMGVFDNRLEKYILRRDAPIDYNNNFVGMATIANAPLWNGEEVIGFLATDNLVKQEPITERYCEFLCLYAATLGHLSSFKKAQAVIEESEKRYRNLFEESKDTIFISNTEGYFVDINKAGLELFGYETEEEIFQVNIASQILFDPNEQRKYLSKIELDGFVKNYSLEMKTKEGKKIDVLLTASVVRDEKGKTIAYRGIIRDITNQKSLEQQLMQAQKMESLGTLAGGLAHDFNNILGGILGYSSFIKTKMDVSNPYFKYIETIENSAMRAAELTSQLLSFSRSDRFNIRPIDVNSIIREILNIITRTFDKSIEIIPILDDRLPTVEGDAGQIQQVIMNLCVNARDSMPNGGKLILETAVQMIDDDYVKSHLSVKKGNYVTFTISDSGTGMDQETKNRIFEPFFTTKEKGKGTGLGLAMVYGVVKSHEGFISVYTEIGMGTTFKIYLPVSGKKQEFFSSIESDIDCRGTETVLVVDDEETICKFMKELLEAKGYTVLTANNGEEAVDIFSEHKDEIALVILDLIMPKMGGDIAFGKMKEIGGNFKTILISGYSKVGKAQELMDSGVDCFIQKPFKGNNLLVQAKKLLMSVEE